MTRRVFSSVIAASFLLCALVTFAAEKPALTKVACIGDSITFGHGIKDRNKNSFPAQLATMLGESYEVKNFGVSASTLLKKGNKPYWKLPQFKAAQDYQPDIVIIKLGTNDTKPGNWKHKQEFKPDYIEMVKVFQGLESKPAVWTCYPVPVFPERWGINDKTVKEEVIPLIDEVAKETGAKVIDLYKPLVGKPELVPDKVHPNAGGAKIIAETIAAALDTPLAAIELGAPFGNNAVFQQQIPVPVWGTSQPGAKITVHFGSQKKSAVASDDGKWKVTLAPMSADKLISINEAPKGRSLTVVSERDGTSETKTFKNILIGEVWLCAGQSNMAGAIRTNKTRHFPEDTVEQANYPALRQVLGAQSASWVVCSPETAPEFKKVAFFFARRMQRDALVPVGLVMAAVGGSNIESWLNQKPFERGKNYDRLISPIVGYGIRGALWYQGESNASDGRKYLPKLTSLIEGWRRVWGQGDFPFYIVQLPGIGEPTKGEPDGGGGWPETRNAQFSALSIKNTGMAITIDIGDRSVHPPNKYDTGVRLARLALHNDYGFKDLVPTGPLYLSHKIEGKTIRIQFSCAQNGLMLAKKEGFLPPKPTPDATISWLSLQSKDGVWHWAEGKIDGSDLIVASNDVKEPVAVRYAYTGNPAGVLLYNKDGLPASPFSTCGY